MNAPEQRVADARELDQLREVADCARGIIEQIRNRPVTASPYWSPDWRALEDAVNNWENDVMPA